MTETSGPESFSSLKGYAILFLFFSFRDLRDFYLWTSFLTLWHPKHSVSAEFLRAENVYVLALLPNVFYC